MTQASARWRGFAAIVLAGALAAPAAKAEVVAPAPAAAIEVPYPEGTPVVDVRVVFVIDIGAGGEVRAAEPTSRDPLDAPEAFVEAARNALLRATFRPALRDGRPVSARIRYVVEFHPPARVDETALPPAAAPPSPAAAAPAEAKVKEVQIRGQGWASPRGLGDVRVQRDVLDASPRQQTSEMLSAAPGFFVDHEDGEGLGNDVYLRGFDLDHGSGIEMRVGAVPINNPVHIQGQGYADANFIIPEVVRSVRVLEGPFDPRQGDAAIVGSAYFDLGVPERGYRLGGSYGSFGQARLVAIAAPREADEDTFAAVSLRRTDGFGANRAGASAAANLQYGVDLGARDHLRVLLTAYDAHTSLAGVVRQDDVDAHRIGFYDSYPYYTQNQGARSSRMIVAQELEHVEPSGARAGFSSWFMWTAFRNRQNYGGNVEISQLDPTRFGLGDLFETSNREAAAGLMSHFRGAPLTIGDVAEAICEPGIYVRAGHTDQAKSLLVPSDTTVWDRRIDSGVATFDAGAYLDFDVRLWKRLRFSGGPRADLLAVSVDDRLRDIVGSSAAPARREGVAPGVHATAEYELVQGVTPVLSYGQGFRSLDAGPLPRGSSRPYSTVRSVEAGLRLALPDERYTVRLSAFETWVGNELVFEANSGGLERQNASVRRGLLASIVAKPREWLLISSAASLSDAVFATRIPGISHHVPNVPSVLVRTDATARGRLGMVGGTPVTGRVGIGYTFLAGRHLTDAIVGPANHVLNTNLSLRRGALEIGVDAYNLLGLAYADDQEVYTSNWSFQPGQQPASLATHTTAAPPRTVLGTVSIYF